MLKRTEINRINEIANRAAKMAVAYEMATSEPEVKRTFLMDLMAVHEHSCRLRLDDLLTADDSNFAHDVFGINQHLNRKTYQLEDCFLPRFAA